jgi:hypothetical protein
MKKFRIGIYEAEAVVIFLMTPAIVLHLGRRMMTTNSEILSIKQSKNLVWYYVEDCEEFLKDWNSGEYEPAGSLVFNSEDIEIIQELLRKEGK